MRDIEPGDYARFLTYAPRVVSIVEEHPHLAGLLFPRLRRLYIHQDLLPAFERHCPNTPLLPKLRALSYTSAPGCIVPTRGFISPSLTKVMVVMNEPLTSQREQELVDIVQDIRSSCHHLRDLTISLEPCPDRLKDIIEPTLLNMTVLTSFSSGRMPISLASLLVLSRITTLRTLKTEATYGVTDTGQFPANAFPTLRTFVLATAATHVVSDLLHAVTSASLDNLDIAIKVMMPRDTVRDIFATLSERYPHLHNLRFAFTDVLNWHTQDVIPVSHVEPLLNLHELIEVDMAVCPVAVDDQLLRAISNSWRQLERLEMGVSYGMPQEAASVSLLGLAYLSHGCKELVMVGLPLDVSDLSRLPAGIAALPFALGIRSTSPLAWLHVGRSPIEDPVSVAAYMSDICPNVMTISTHAVISADAGEDVDDWVIESNRRLLRWTGVQRLLEGFVRVRQQERRWMQNASARCAVERVAWDDTQADMLGRVLESEQVQMLANVPKCVCCCAMTSIYELTVHVSLLLQFSSAVDAEIRRISREEGYPVV